MQILKEIIEMFIKHPEIEVQNLGLDLALGQRIGE